MKVTIDEQAKTMTVVVDLEEPRPSASGKTLVVASTRGNVVSGAKLGGKDVVLGLNAYVRK